MRIAITTPTGNIGSKVVDNLLDRGDHELLLLARDAGKLEDATARGAKVAEGNLEDADYVKTATENVDTLFLVFPPNYQADDMKSYYRKLAENAVGAIKANNIKNVVFVSSLGAHLGEGVGPVNAFKQVEEMLRDTVENLTILRPTYFMENYAATLQGVAEAKSVFLPISPDASVPMIATQDIADAAADLLAKPLSGQKVIPLHGPKDYSFDEAANILGDVIGQDVDHVKVTPDQAREAMGEMGISDHMAGLMVEMYEAIESGHMRPEEPRSPETTTPTTFKEFARTSLLPMMKANN